MVISESSPARPIEKVQGWARVSPIFLALQIRDPVVPSWFSVATPARVSDFSPQDPLTHCQIFSSRSTLFFLLPDRHRFKTPNPTRVSACLFLTNTSLQNLAASHACGGSFLLVCIVCILIPTDFVVSVFDTSLGTVLNTRRCSICVYKIGWKKSENLS